jgi:adenylyltransferase and sulfurtransferase
MKDTIEVLDSRITNSTSHHPALIPPPALASCRYNRQLLLPQISLPGQNRLLDSKVLLVGLGGLGSPASLYLAGAGIGTLGFVDADLVETSNLHRQIVHREDSAVKSLSKVQSAIRGCQELNSEIEYIGHEDRLSVENALDIIEQYDMVLDCTDNPATRYLISDACVVLGKTLVSGAAQRLEGQMVVLNYPIAVPSAKNTTPETKRGPCYRCIFPHPPNPEMVRGCNEIGILGPVVGCIGILMATEAIRLIVQNSSLNHPGQDHEAEERKPSMLLYRAWSPDPKSMFRTVMLAGRRKNCLACGDEEILRQQGKQKITREVFENKKGRLDYEAWCGRVEDVKLLGKEQRVGAKEFLDLVGRGDNQGVVIDVREENEVVLGSKIKGAVNLPISRILRSPEEAFDCLQQIGSDHGNIGNEGSPGVKSGSVYFLCQRGNDSQIAAQKLMDLDEQYGDGRRWFGDVEGGFLALEKIQAGRQ